MFPQMLLLNVIFLLVVIAEAFFDMYVGDLPVSVQAKQEIASNVGGLIKRCWEMKVVHWLMAKIISFFFSNSKTW